MMSARRQTGPTAGSVFVALWRAWPLLGVAQRARMTGRLMARGGVLLALGVCTVSGGAVVAMASAGLVAAAVELWTGWDGFGEWSVRPVGLALFLLWQAMVWRHFGADARRWRRATLAALHRSVHVNLTALTAEHSVGGAQSSVAMNATPTPGPAPHVPAGPRLLLVVPLVLSVLLVAAGGWYARAARRPECRARQAEARRVLKTLYIMEHEHRARTGRWADLAELKHKEERRLEDLTATRFYTIMLNADEHGFTAVAVDSKQRVNPAAEEAIDVWVLTNTSPFPNASTNACER